MKKRVHPDGFTLVEVIAVLVILGIIGAMAVPKYYDLQYSAQKQAAQAALSGIGAAAYLAYAQAVANGFADATSWGGSGTAVVGDFQGNFSDNNGLVALDVTAGPNWLSLLAPSDRSGTVRMY